MMVEKIICTIKRKMNSGGESMAEVLVAALIIELALIAAVTMIMSAGRIIVQSKKNYEKFYELQNNMAKGESVTDSAGSITLQPTGTDPTISPISVTLKQVTDSGSGKTTYYYVPTASPAAPDPEPDSEP